MRIDIATLFTQMCDSVLNESIVGRGIRNGFIEVYTHDIRKYTENKHRRVDDKPYGGGTGMLMQAQPVYDCISAIKSQGEGKPRIIYMSPQGEVLTQQKVQELAQEPWLILLCGHYEGIDQRVLDELEVEELSVGNYVLTGGELPALIVADAVARLQPGVLPNEDAYSIESHYNGLLEFRSTPARRNGTGAESRRCSSRETTAPSPSGRTVKRCGLLQESARICTGSLSLNSTRGSGAHSWKIRISRRRPGVPALSGSGKRLTRRTGSRSLLCAGKSALTSAFSPGSFRGAASI